MNKIFFFLCCFILCNNLLIAQIDTPQTEEFNFDDFGDADSTPIKNYCTSKVNYLSPTKLISIGYEVQLPFDIATQNKNNETDVQFFRGVRLGFNTPIISRSNVIINLGMNYWNTAIDYHHAPTDTFFQEIGKGLRSTGINTTIFKPLNNKHFIIIQAQADLNGNYTKLNQLSIKALTYSGAAIFGWKKNDNLMWGLGVSRTYRAGQVLHIPVVLLNKTFNKTWGIEMLLPARFNARYNFSTNSYLMLGYEIEGNTFLIHASEKNSELFLRRGELKPRISYERQIKNFIWFSAQAGWRYNWRFDAFNTQNPTKNEKVVLENELRNPLYFNIGFHFVSP